MNLKSMENNRGKTSKILGLPNISGLSLVTFWPTQMLRIQ
jgi:hypothetical protein